MQRMSLSTLLVLVALAGSIAALAYHAERIFPAIAVLVSGVETLMAFSIIKLSVKGVPLMLALGALLAIAAGVVWFKSSAKLATTGATAATLVGLIQVLAAVNVAK
jgi:hypothetical protein